MSARAVVLSGCSGGGKSTLVDALGRRGYATVPEAGRMLVAELNAVGRTDLPGTSLFGELLLSRSMVLYDQAMATHSEGIVFFDRSVIEPLAGWAAVGEEQPWHANVIRRYRYDPVVFLVPPWREIYRKDAERLHGFEAAVAEYERLCDAFPRYGYEVCIVPKGDVETRVEAVLAHLAGPAMTAGGAA